MAAVIEYRISGLKEAEAKLEALGTTGIPKILNKTIKRGAVVLKNAVKAEAHFEGQSRTDPGGLVRGIRYKVIRSVATKKGSVGYVAGPFGKGTAHRHLVTAGHRLPNGGRTRANPFVERGREAGMPGAVAAVEAALQAAVDEEMS